MKNPASIILVIFILMLFTSCKFNGNINNSEIYDVGLIDSLPYSLFTLDTTDASCITSFKHCPTAKFSLPVFQTPDSSLNIFLNSEVQKMILYKTESTMFPSINAYLENYFADNSELKKQGDYDDESSAWENEKNVKVFNKKGKHLTLESDEYSFCGGAHPNSFSVFKTYDLIIKKQISARDLFINLNDTALLRIGEHYFRNDNEIADSTKLSETGFFIFGDGDDFENGPNYGKFHFNDNYALTKDGIQFLYNRYEIGPYFLGAPRFTIPYTELRYYLKITVW